MSLQRTTFFASIFYVLVCICMVGLVACGGDEKTSGKEKVATKTEKAAGNNNKNKPAANKKPNAKAKVYKLNEVDVKPIFGKKCPTAKNPAGCSRRAIASFIQSNVKFPESAIKNNQKGKERVTFVLRKNGKIGNVKYVSTVNGDCADCKKAAVDAVAKMKDWKPGMKDGKPVDVRMSLPIAFSTK